MALSALFSSIDKRFSRSARAVRKGFEEVAMVRLAMRAYEQLDDTGLRLAWQGLRTEGKPVTGRYRINGLALACVAAERALGLAPFDVQIVGAGILLDGKIAEMRTGEGKTLTAAIAASVQALAGGGVHVVTVNAYLAERDGGSLAPFFNKLGLEVGTALPGLDMDGKRAAYGADVTYVTSTELGFDHLRDNMALRPEDRVMRPMAMAIVDEVDSILIDEARTPLIISGPIDDAKHIYAEADDLVRGLDRQMDSEFGEGDYWADEKNRRAHLSETGMEKVETILRERGMLGAHDSLYAPGNIDLVHHIQCALLAHSIYRKDIEYIVRDGKVQIVDEFTGRVLAGRRWGDGVHQAIEAKEGVEILPETQTVASISLQNYFRQYPLLAGMTGTAATDAEEFMDIYGLGVVVIPTHRPMIRVDEPDTVFVGAARKMDCIIEDICDIHATGRPILVGTASVDASEVVSARLSARGIAHQVLNAKQHGREAAIIADAGLEGAVTIATNMAGRGTDIVLGGHPERGAGEAAWKARHDRVVALGGLHVIGVERHESRRVDNQLRGRAGRQGDPGSSRFYISFDDTLLRLFAPAWAGQAILRMGDGEDKALSSGLIGRQIERAQRAVEAHNFEARRDLLKFDDVANEQRLAVYGWRNAMLDAENEAVVDYAKDIAATVAGAAARSGWSETGFEGAVNAVNAVRPGFSVDDGIELDALVAAAGAHLQAGVAGVSDIAYLRWVTLRSLDLRWRDHLWRMDLLRQGIGLRGFAQKKPEQEYKREAFDLFSEMWHGATGDMVAQWLAGPPVAARPAARPGAKTYTLSVFGPDPVRRNSACSCGSGKRFKHCHGWLGIDKPN